MQESRWTIYTLTTRVSLLLLLAHAAINSINATVTDNFTAPPKA